MTGSDRGRFVKGVAALALLVGVLMAAPTRSGASTLNDLDGEVSIDCTSWSITGVPFGQDVDGDGQVTVTVEVWDYRLYPNVIVQPAALLGSETLSFAPGTTHDLSGTFTASPVLNPLVLVINDEQIGSTYMGACDGLDWAPPQLSVFVTDPGAPDVKINAWGSCYGTTLETTILGSEDSAVGTSVSQATTRTPSSDQRTIPVPGGIAEGTYQIRAVCGSFTSPLSDVASVSFSVPGMPPPPASTTPPSVGGDTGAPGAVETSPAFTG